MGKRKICLDSSFSRSFCALLHHFEPQLIDYHSLSFTPENAEKNLELAFKKATSVGIPALLDADDIVDYQDDKCIYTYLLEYEIFVCSFFSL